MEASLSDVEKAQRVYTTCIDRTIANGTTTASYYATIHVESTNILASLCKTKGQRALIGRVCMDNKEVATDYYYDESLPAAMEATKAVIDHIDFLDPHGHHVAPVLTPRSCVSCTHDFLLQLADLSKNKGHRIQTHLSENVDEIELVHRIWPGSESYTDVYESHGLLTDKTILAHAIHLSPSEQSLIAQRGAKISHCPVSNSALGSGICPVRTLLDAGITVGLGTDISGGYSPSILEIVRQACLVSRLLAQSKEDERLKLSVEEALWLATRGGAEVVGWKNRVGAFESGMQWDAQLIRFDSVPSGTDDTKEASVTGEKHGIPDDHPENVEGEETNVKIFGWENWEDRIAKWVYAGDDRNTRRVWIGGRLVHSKDR
ncbi:putative guanine deaminase [Phaeomoniella chlamydospora]|uniref:Putative guanine deaminase n=1 Tax=Phaeomoniella chlamydospora TaxID=158046 RepID=A0A0G2EKZ1_PHACM|nr:putative guanine deaminase [Phaeomoniella chlamydospora]